MVALEEVVVVLLEALDEGVLVELEALDEGVEGKSGTTT
jgi:hypothetical protein